MSQSSFIAESPQGRYKKWDECLGAGSFKKVYRGWDTAKGKDVAWNEIYVAGLSEKEKERFSSEVELLRSIDDDHFIKYYSSWYDPKEEMIILITQIVTSGTLNNYVKGKQLTMEAIKRWSIQILEGLDYLHTRHPPIIHRDLKCSNIFIDGKTSKIMIGDLGLSKRRWEGAQMSIAGTPEFMAPEIFANGNYDEKVDIYAFGMCVLELITKKIPYCECHSIKEIYTKVTSGELPECFDDLRDESSRAFIRKLVAQGPSRPSAGELLRDPFLITKASDSQFIEVDSIIMERERLEKQGNQVGHMLVAAKEHSPSQSSFHTPSLTDNQICSSMKMIDPHTQTDLINDNIQCKVIDIGPFSESALDIDLDLTEKIDDHVSNFKSPLQRSSSISFNSSTILSSSLYPTVQQRIVHRKTFSSSSNRTTYGTGSGTLSPSVIIANIPSPGRGHVHTVSLESVTLNPETGELIPIGATEIPQGFGIPQVALGGDQCMPQLQLEFRGSRAETPLTPREIEASGSESEREGRQEGGREEEEVIDSIHIALSKQDAVEFTFRVVCNYYKGSDRSTKSTWTQLVRYTYGISRPENLVSDLISNGIIREGSLLPIAVAFESWLNEVIYNPITMGDDSDEMRSTGNV